jgi:hypothetical protein
MEEHRPIFYANSVQAASNIFDVTLTLRSQSPQVDSAGDISEINGQPAIVVNDEQLVQMSPQHAKAFAIVLVESIKNYEKSYGTKLPVPLELQEKWDAIIK